MADDPLEPLLELALRGGALTKKGLPAFAQALRERAGIILEARVRALEEQASVLAKENAWRGELASNLEAENRWRAEAMQTLEERLAALAKENDWKAELLAATQQENRWRGHAMQTLEARNAALAHENEWARRTIQALQGEMGTLRQEWRTTAEAHDRLLAHHRSLLSGLAQALTALPAALPWGFRRVRARLIGVVAALRKELG